MNITNISNEIQKLNMDRSFNYTMCIVNNSEISFINMKDKSIKTFIVKQSSSFLTIDVFKEGEKILNTGCDYMDCDNSGSYRYILGKSLINEFLKHNLINVYDFLISIKPLLTY